MYKCLATDAARMKYLTEARGAKGSFIPDYVIGYSKHGRMLWGVGWTYWMDILDGHIGWTYCKVKVYFVF
jgi:hypothetical protein